MDDHDRHVDQPGMADGAVGGLAFRDPGMGLAVVTRGGAALGLQAAGQVPDRVMPLGVDHQRAALLATSKTSSN